MPHPQRFSGESVVSWSDLDITISVPWYLGLMFRTRKEDGVLMAATAGMASRLRLQVRGDTSHPGRAEWGSQSRPGSTPPPGSTGSPRTQAGNLTPAPPPSARTGPAGSPE